MGAKAKTRPATIKDQRKVEQAMRQRLLPFPVRRPRVIPSAVSLPLISVIVPTPIVARLSSLVCMFDSDSLELDKKWGVAGNNSLTARTAQSLVSSDSFIGFPEQF